MIPQNSPSCNKKTPLSFCNTPSPPVIPHFATHSYTLSSLVLHSTPFFSVIASPLGRCNPLPPPPHSSLRGVKRRSNPPSFSPSLRAVRRGNPPSFIRHCTPFFLVIASRQAWQSIPHFPRLLHIRSQ